MEHEYNANWMPRITGRRIRAKRQTAKLDFKVIAKYIVIGMIAGYILGLAQQAVQKTGKVQVVEARYE